MMQPKVVVEIVQGKAVEHYRSFDGSAFLIGSAEDCDLVLGAPNFPEVHAYLLRHHDGVSIRYLGAKPALTVNGRLVRSEVLADGDRIATGPYEFVVHITKYAITGTRRRPHFDRLNTALSESAISTAEVTSETQLVQIKTLALLRDVRTALEGDKQLRLYKGQGQGRPFSNAAG